jgi:uncharacterized ferritin-like protein (DUF455 family)
MYPPTLRRAAFTALAEPDAGTKAALALALDGALPTGAGEALVASCTVPGRPGRPALVAHTAVPQRSIATPEGRAALLHALAHIEFNAIDLALDACWRFGGLPDAYYRDWAQVAREEAHHFQLLRAHLNTLGFDYGDFPAHGALWEMAERTAHDVLARVALVPRTLEARGLDASPPMRAKLLAAGDAAAAAIVDTILADEIGHVAIGNRWYAWLCAQRGLEPVAHYAVLARAHRAPRPRGPFYRTARRAAGFTDAELDALDAAALPSSPPPMRR